MDVIGVWGRARCGKRIKTPLTASQSFLLLLIEFSCRGFSLQCKPFLHTQHSHSSETYQTMSELPLLKTLHRVSIFLWNQKSYTVWCRSLQPQDLKPDDLRWSWCNNNKIKYTINTMCWNLPQAIPSPWSRIWKNCASTKLIPGTKNVGAGLMDKSFMIRPLCFSPSSSPWTSRATSQAPQTLSWTLWYCFSLCLEILPGISTFSWGRYSKLQFSPTGTVTISSYSIFHGLYHHLTELPEQPRHRTATWFLSRVLRTARDKTLSEFI